MCFGRFLNYLLFYEENYFLLILDNEKVRINRAALRENLSLGFSTRSNTNWAVQSQQTARGLKGALTVVIEVTMYRCLLF